MNQRKSGARRGFTGNSRSSASRSPRRRSPSTWAVERPRRRRGARSSTTTSGAGLRGLLHRAHGDLQGVVRLRGPGAPSATRRPLQRDRHPTAQWTAQQIVEAFPWDTAPAIPPARPRCGLRGSVLEPSPAIGIHEVKIAPRSPWQNPYVERLIGTLRRECLDHAVVFNDTTYVGCCETTSLYYHSVRTHLSLEKDAPEPRPVERPHRGSIVETPWSAASVIATAAGPRKFRPAVCTGHARRRSRGLPSCQGFFWPPAGRVGPRMGAEHASPDRSR